MRHGLNQQDLRAVSMADREERDSGKRCESVLERRGSRRSAVYILGMAHAHWLTPSNRGPISIRAKHVTAYSGRYTRPYQSMVFSSPSDRMALYKCWSSVW